MKCMYYLAPTLVSTHQVSQDLKDVGIEEWHVHIISKDEAGLKNERLHSSNWFETTGLFRNGAMGAGLGLVAGILVAGIMLMVKPFGPDVPSISYFFLVAVATLFGAWVGGLVGMDNENKKLKKFRPDIEAGSYLILIYARKGMGEKIETMMQERHPEAQYVAADRHFINPFSSVERRRRSQAK